ncbi:hypothetical protein VQ03_14930 [Methylobacterium tarhaniae]|uniref:Nudix hydrolase domain-containing protein n=1 Tax=Methylobacterium tarhaniae TaxID=1187852 RepID=A0A0J6T225_9HYPH|nr:NUDIX hydrolase [Methylobacterium tarhaniae]KMO39897.1 hypothetical protein VQ03_14930 [Methylobacterium tarhaniae]
MESGAPFHGGKIALLHDRTLLVYLRDDKPDIPYPACWDLPGGGREGSESPLDCVRRESREEFGIDILPEAIIWQTFLPPALPGRAGSYFFVATLDAVQISKVVFGDEGQDWAMMDIDEYIDHPRGIQFLKQRLKEFLKASGYGNAEGQ